MMDCEISDEWVAKLAMPSRTRLAFIRVSGECDGNRGDFAELASAHLYGTSDFRLIP